MMKLLTMENAAYLGVATLALWVVYLIVLVSQCEVIVP